MRLIMLVTDPPYVLYLMLTALLSMAAASSSNHNNNNLCPVSSLIDTPVDSILPYPSHYTGANVSEIAREHAFNCASMPHYKAEFFGKHGPPHANYHVCLAKTCPVRPAFLEEAAKVGKQWPNDASAVRELEKALLQPEKESQIELPRVNIVVFGGSMTTGPEAIGNCCRQANTYPCPTVGEVFSPNFPVELRQETAYCHWFGYLSRWFRAR